jgi:hypothetical protein
VLLGSNAESSQHRALVILIGDAKARLKSDFLTVLTQQLGAKRMDGAALDAVGIVAELFQPLGDLSCCFVGESENANATCVDAELFDEIANALDQTKRLAGTRAGEDERRSTMRIYGRLLGRCWRALW